MSRGRGRGRGRGKPFGNLEILGIAPGEAAPPPILQPPPNFPPLDRKPLELRRSEIDDYLLTVKQDVREFMKKSPFYLKAGSNRREIQRYSDRYQEIKDSEIDNVLGWEPDWNYFPVELQIGKKRPKRGSSGKSGVKVTPAININRKRKHDELETDTASPSSNQPKRVTFNEDNVGIDKKLSQLEKLEEKTEGKQTAGGEEGAETGPVDEAEEFYDEELEEEGTDYNMTYFDNGEDYIGEDDTLEDNEGPYY